MEREIPSSPREAAPRAGGRARRGRAAAGRLCLLAGLAACQAAPVAERPARAPDESTPAAVAGPSGGAPQGTARAADAGARTAGLPAPPSGDAKAAPGGVTVALLAPLSGEHVALGEGLRRAAQMALFDIADERFVLRFYDTMGRPDGARRAAARAVEDGARLILGPLFLESVRAASPVAREAAVGVIAFSNDRAAAGPGAFLIGHLPGDQIDRVVSFAASKGIRRFAALVPDNRFGARIIGALRAAARANRAAVARVATYRADGKSIDAAVRELANYGRPGGIDFEAVLVPSAGDAIQSILARLPYYGVPAGRVRVLGLSTWQELGMAREPSLRGAWYPSAGAARQAGFRQRFETLYGYRPGALAVLAYDAAAVAATLARRAGAAGLGVGALTHPAGFAGMSGLFRFRADGLNERAYAISEIGPQGVRIVGEAKRGFGTEGGPKPAT